MAGGAEAGGPSDTAVVLEPRPGSLLEGSLWHPDPSTLSGEDALRVLSEIGFARSFLAALEALALERVRQACESEATAAVAGTERRAVRFGGDVGRALAVSEVAVAEGITEFAAARLLTASEALCGPQLAVLTRLEGGALSEAHARVITDETATLPESVAEEFGIECLRRLETRTGRRRTAGEFRKAVRSLRERLHPESVQARRGRAQRDRGVWLKPEPDGMCTLTALLPGEVGLGSFAHVDALARTRRESDPEEGRTLPQLRADILASLVMGEGSRGEGENVEWLPQPRAEIVVHIPAESLLGANEEPGELEGYGSIDAPTARELAVAAPSWQRLFVGEDGVPLSLGRSSYRPSKGLRRFIQYRDGTCQFPGCARAARRTEIDHMIEWQDGGTTDAANLQALCAGHHALKSLRLWKPSRLAGNILWTSRLGARTLSGSIDREFGMYANERVPGVNERVPGANERVPDMNEQLTAAKVQAPTMKGQSPTANEQTAPPGDPEPPPF